jgi:DNA-binding GntR family transcriptional regulator
VTAAIRQLVEETGPTPNAPLPSIGQLAQRYGVSIKTVRKSLRPLESEGLVVVIESRGPFVAPR